MLFEYKASSSYFKRKQPAMGLTQYCLWAAYCGTPYHNVASFMKTIKTWDREIVLAVHGINI